jgi:hypothetical protein
MWTTDALCSNRTSEARPYKLITKMYKMYIWMDEDRQEET